MILLTLIFVNQFECRRQLLCTAAPHFHPKIVQIEIPRDSSSELRLACMLYLDKGQRDSEQVYPGTVAVALPGPNSITGQRLQ